MSHKPAQSNHNKWKLQRCLEPPADEAPCVCVCVCVCAWGGGGVHRILQYICTLTPQHHQMGSALRGHDSSSHSAAPTLPIFPPYRAALIRVCSLKLLLPFITNGSRNCFPPEICACYFSSYRSCENTDMTQCHQGYSQLQGSVNK